jgi:hypothetical protein
MDTVGYYSDNSKRLDNSFGRGFSAPDQLLCRGLVKTMKTDTIKILDVVALVEAVPEKNLKKGQVGTVVEELTSEVFEVEFSDLQGRTYAQAALQATKLMVLHHEPIVSP